MHKLSYGSVSKSYTTACLSGKEYSCLNLRDAIYIQMTVRKLIDKGVTVDIHALGPVGRGVGELIVAVLAKVVNMEREKIIARTMAGREAPFASLTATGKTHKGKDSMGCPLKGGKAAVVAWRDANKASFRRAAEKFGLSEATVKRYVAQAKAA
jgi:putative DNA-invertase from lambdoid prophage Rac